MFLIEPIPATMKTNSHIQIAVLSIHYSYFHCNHVEVLNLFSKNIIVFMPLCTLSDTIDFIWYPFHLLIYLLLFCLMYHLFKLVNQVQTAGQKPLKYNKLPYLLY